MEPYVHCSIIYNSQDIEAARVSIDRQIKMWYIHTMHSYLAIKKNKILPFAMTWVDLGGVMLSEVSQRQMPHDFT